MSLTILRLRNLKENLLIMRIIELNIREVNQRMEDLLRMNILVKDYTFLEVMQSGKIMII